MKLKWICAAAALLLLAGCGDQQVQESKPAAEINSPAPIVPAQETAAEPPVAEKISESQMSVPLSEEPNEEEEPVELPVETAEAEESPAPLDRPTDQEVLAAYQAAKEVVGWMVDSNSVKGYDDSGLALDDTDQQTLTLTLGNGTEETLVFDRITRPGLDSMEALRGYLKNSFSDEIVDDLMAFQVPVFVEGEQGGLYALPSQVQDFQQPGATLAVLWTEEEEPVSCRVQAVNEGEEQYRESLYQKVGDKWIFTQFEIPYSDKK